MHYELAVLDNLVREVSTAYQLDDAAAGRMLNQFTAEAAGVRLRMIEQVINTRDNMLNELYVQTHQKALAALAEELLDYRKKANELKHSSCRMELINALCGQVEGLLSFILKMLDKYFNGDLPLSSSYAVLARQELEPEWRAVQQLYEGIPEMDEDLFAIAVRPLREFVIENNRITYRQLNYLKDLAAQLQAILNNGNEPHTLAYWHRSVSTELDRIALSEPLINIQLHIVLSYLNYNHYEYTNYCTNALRRKTDEKPDIELKLTLLRAYSKLLRQLNIKPGSAFDPDAKPHYLQMLEWIAVEEEFLLAAEGRIGEVDSYSSNASGETMSVAVRDSGKLVTTFNVKELAFIMRVIKETGRIEATATEIINFMVRNYCSKGSDDLSFDSMYNKWWNIKNTTVQTGRDFFLECVNKTRKWL